METGGGRIAVSPAVIIDSSGGRKVSEKSESCFGFKVVERYNCVIRVSLDLCHLHDPSGRVIT